MARAVLPWSCLLVLCAAALGRGQDIILERDDSLASTPPNQPKDPFDNAQSRFLFESPTAPAFECALDADAFQPCVSPQEVQVVDGLHTFTVRAVNNIANAAAHTWTTDTLDPVVTLTARPALLSATGLLASFSVSSNEAVMFECSDAFGPSPPFEPCTPADAMMLANTRDFDRGPLEDGRHRISIRGCDEAGNCGTPVVYEFSVDACVSAGTCKSSNCDTDGAGLDQCDCGPSFFLDLTNFHICRQCRSVVNAGCNPVDLHCTNGVDSVCGDCVSGFNPSTEENFKDCQLVTVWS